MSWCLSFGDVASARPISIVIMSVVLPGELMHSQHKTLKLGPGLQQSVDLQGRAAFVVTRAGTLEQNAKGNKFWVEGNSRRVRCIYIAHLSVRRLNA